LLPVSRLFVASFLAVFIIGVGTAKADDIPQNELAAMRAAVAAGHAGDWSKAYADLAGIKDPLARKILDWLDFCRASPAGRFAEITAFIKNNSDWPSLDRLRRQAEEAAAGAPDAAVSAWFILYPPLSAPGQVREAEVKLAAGDTVAGTAELRAAWIDDDFTPAEEKSFLARHGGAIRPQDNVKRLDRLIWDGRMAAAHHMFALVSPDYRALAEARIALLSAAPKAALLVARVPEQLRADPGLSYAELRNRVKADDIDGAVKILVGQPGDLVRPSAWWAQRQIVARRVLGTGNADLAYQIVAQHGLIEGKSYSEAQFLLGYIALRYMKKPDLAFTHFSHVLTRVSSANAKARAGYWGARAAEGEGKAELAAKWYAAGAQYTATFYGQLAAHALGKDAPPHPIPEPAPTGKQLAAFNSQELVRASAMFFDLGEIANGAAFLMREAALAKDATEFGMLARLAEAHGRTELAIAVAKRAVDAGMPLTVHGYPVIGVPPGGSAEHALLYAIVRQESGFASDAVSPVGARGLMQLMPATATAIAKKLQVAFTPAKLTQDGSFNVLLGRTYIESLLDDFGGSYALAIAAYNAGPGRVRQWLHDYGDPRGGRIDMVDWIELIPVNETRNYVQRVLENLQVYREQNGRASAFTLVSDLAR
jgi:soluble lytic murein transglycosylase